MGIMVLNLLLKDFGVNGLFGIRSKFFTKKLSKYLGVSRVLCKSIQ